MFGFNRTSVRLKLEPTTPTTESSQTLQPHKRSSETTPRRSAACAACRFNRTSVRLKPVMLSVCVVTLCCFNRTSVRLKPARRLVRVRSRGFNRTSVRLKPFLQEGEGSDVVLLQPHKRSSETWSRSCSSSGMFWLQPHKRSSETTDGEAIQDINKVRASTAQAFV